MLNSSAKINAIRQARGSTVAIEIGMEIRSDKAPIT